MISYYVEEAKLSYIMGTLNKTIRDREDYFILSCAIAAEADYLVTGDNDLLILEKYENVKIVTPAQFIKMI